MQAIKLRVRFLLVQIETLKSEAHVGNSIYAVLYIAFIWCCTTSHIHIYSFRAAVLRDITTTFCRQTCSSLRTSEK